MTLFFDRSVGRSIPRALDVLGLSVEHHDQHFGGMTKDDVWLAHVGQQGWIAVTLDERLRWNRSHLRALTDHKVGCFIICGAGSRPRWYAVRIIARNWDVIEDICAKQVRPFLYRIYLHRPLSRDYPDGSKGTA